MMKEMNDLIKSLAENEEPVLSTQPEIDASIKALTDYAQNHEDEDVTKLLDMLTDINERAKKNGVFYSVRIRGNKTINALRAALVNSVKKGGK